MHMPIGEFNIAAVAAPPSPEYPAAPVPAIIVVMPDEILIRRDSDFLL